MEIIIVLLALVVGLVIGMPVSYALGVSALIGAWWAEIPLQAVMLQVSSGVSKFVMLPNLGVGLCHPPVGAIIFVGCAVGAYRWKMSCATSGRSTC